MQQISSSGTSSKKWWKLASIISSKEGGSSCIPPLTCIHHGWALDAKNKADLLATTLAAKFQLPELSANSYSDIRQSNCCMSGFLPVRLRHVSAVLRHLREDSATGPDKLGTKVLRRFPDLLAVPVSLIARKILSSGHWPESWRTHWVFPLYKKKSKANPANYRGIHLSPQLSKAMERILSRHWFEHIEATTATGRNQFAYRKGLSYKDALAFNVCSWLWDLCLGRRVALHLGDVSGAFDKVPSVRLMQKLEAKGVHPNILNILQSWLRGRDAIVIVDGAESFPMRLANMVFQGTVWGPILWSIYYEDVQHAVQTHGFTESVYADDLICFRSFPGNTGNPVIESFLRKCQSEIHSWGASNAVSFDAEKEGQNILGFHNASGPNFTLLGVLFDPALSMFHAVGKLVREASFRLSRVLRLRQHYATRELVRFYKSEVLSYLEGATAAVYHATPFVLAGLDELQSSFLQSLGLSEEVALRELHLAPLGARRDMAMLGLLHRVSLGKAPASLSKLFPPSRSTIHSFGWTVGPPHSRQLADQVTSQHPTTLRRSLFGLVAVYNRLPAHIANASSVKSFQAALQRAMVARSQSTSCHGWQHMFKRIV